jgi:hypothetical protein
MCQYLLLLGLKPEPGFSSQSQISAMSEYSLPLWWPYVVLFVWPLEKKALYFFSLRRYQWYSPRQWCHLLRLLLLELSNDLEKARYQCSRWVYDPGLSNAANQHQKVGPVRCASCPPASHSVAISLTHILVHESSVKIAPQQIVDEPLLFSLLFCAPRLVLEDNIVIPPSLHTIVASALLVVQ